MINRYLGKKHLFVVRTIEDKIVYCPVARFPRRRIRASMMLRPLGERMVFRKWRSFRRETVYERQCYDAEHRLCTECAQGSLYPAIFAMPEGRCNATRYRKSILARILSW